VWAFLVEFLAETVEAPLLGGAVARRWAGGLGFKGSVHAFVASVLLGFARLDELGQDTEAYPKGGERGEAGERGGGEGHPVVGANAFGEPELTEEAHEYRFGLGHRSRAQGLAAQKVAAVAVRDRQRIAIDPVAGLEVSLEVGTPHDVGGADSRGRFAWVAHAPACPGLADQTVASEDVADGGAGRPGPIGMASGKRSQELLRAPGGMALARFHEPLHDRLGGLGRASMRASRALGQARRDLAARSALSTCKRSCG
jgi:hypothetical protein